jgi:hypothetical protein
MRPIALLACLAALSCSSVDNEDPNACKQTFGFGNYGCADVTGTVVSASVAPLANVEVSAGGSTDPFEHAEAISNATGQFSMRLLRRWVPTGNGPDTVTTWFHTTVPASGGAPAYVDSSQIQVRFYPLGQKPTATNHTLTTSKP